MANQGTIWSRLLIIAFGAAVVALGAHELNRDYSKRYAGAKARPGDLNHLSGSNVIERAQMRSSAFQPAPPAGSDSISKADKNELQSLIDTVSK